MRRATWNPIVLTLSVLGACQSQDSTKLVITVWSDLAVPAQMDGMHIEVQGQGTTHPFDFKLAASAEPGKTQLPVRLALVPLAAQDEALDIRATALLGTAQIVWQDVHTAFLPGLARELTLFLGRACIGVTTCGTNLTCANGACTQPIAVDPNNLPSYVPNRTPAYPDASGLGSGLDASLGSPLDAASGEAASSRFEVSPDDAGVAAFDAPAEWAPTFDAAHEATTETGAADGMFSRDVPLEQVADAPAPDSAVNAGPDAAPDAVIDSSCTARCTVGSIRCGSAGGSQTCVLVNGCADWSEETPCTGRRVCSGSNPSTGCTCPAAPAGCAAGTGSYCSTNDGSLQTCLQDSDGCVYLATATVCPVQKPCAGNFPSASCSCPAAPIICGNTTGSFCDGTSSVVACTHDTQGCLISAPSKSCPSGKPCAGSAGNADCTCPAGPCTSGTGKSCSGSDIIQCSTDANGCAQGTIQTCSTKNIMPTCSGGVCNGICETGFADCDLDKQSNGCETNTTNDPNHCGSCPVACTAGVVCIDSVCTTTQWGLSGAGPSTASFGAGTLLVLGISISAAAPSLVGLGAQTVDGNILVRFGLYSNNSGAANALVAQTSELISTADGIEGYFAPMSIQPGTYWLALLSQSTVHVAAESVNAQFFYAAQAYGPLPVQAPAMTGTQAPRAHLYAITSP